VVPAQALQQRQPVAVAPQRAPDDVVQHQWRGDRAAPVTSVAPPTPQGVQLSPRVVPNPGQVREVPRPGGERGQMNEGRPGPAPRVEVSPAVVQPAQVQQPQVQQPAPNGWRVQGNPALGGNPQNRDSGFQRPPVAPAAPAVQEAPRGMTPRDAMPQQQPLQQRAPAVEQRQPQAEQPQRGERRSAAPVVEQRQPQVPAQPAAREQNREQPRQDNNRGSRNERGDRRDLN
jgi:hypothetical protein